MLYVSLLLDFGCATSTYSYKHTTFSDGETSKSGNNL